MAGDRASILRARAAISFGLLLCVLCVGCGKPKDTPDEERNLYGVVRNSMTGKELKGVSVSFRSDTLDEADDKTDDDGDYSLLVTTDAKNGRIEAKKSGYETRVVSVYFDDDAVQVDIELNPN